MTKGQGAEGKKKSREKVATQNNYSMRTATLWTAGLVKLKDCIFHEPHSSLQPPLLFYFILLGDEITGLERESDGKRTNGGCT